MQNIIHKKLGFAKVCALWVPKHLPESHKMARTGVCLNNILRYASEGTDFIANIVACDGTKCHRYDPASKRISMESQHTSSSRPKEVHYVQRTGKVMLIFFYYKGPLIIEQLHRVQQLMLRHFATR